MDQLAAGTAGELMGGTFKGVRGVVLSHDVFGLRVRVEVFGRNNDILVKRADFRPSESGSGGGEVIASAIAHVVTPPEGGPDDSPPFALWNVGIDDNGSVVHFDVTALEFQGLGDGTQEQVQEFLMRLGIAARPKAWNVEARCSPYFDRTSAASDDFRDRFPQFWQVKVETDVPVVVRDPSLFLGIAAVSWDVGLAAIDLDEWSSARCVVIANVEPGGVPRLIAAAGDAVKTVEQRHVHPEVTQCRLDIGEVTFPGDEAAVLEVVRRCTESGAITNVDAAMAFEAGGFRLRRSRS